MQQDGQHLHVRHEKQCQNERQALVQIPHQLERMRRAVRDLREECAVALLQLVHNLDHPQDQAAMLQLTGLMPTNRLHQRPSKAPVQMKILPLET